MFDWVVFIVCSFYSHKTSTKLVFLFPPSAFSQSSLYSKIIRPCRDKEDLCFTFQKSSNKPAFHPFRKFHKSVVGILWAGIPQVFREHRRRIFPGILGPVQPQRQLVLSLNAAHFEITQVAELFVSLTVPLWRTWNENNKWREEDKEGVEGEEENIGEGEKVHFFKWWIICLPWHDAAQDHFLWLRFQCVCECKCAMGGRVHFLHQLLILAASSLWQTWRRDAVKAGLYKIYKINQLIYCIARF